MQSLQISDPFGEEALKRSLLINYIVGAGSSRGRWPPLPESVSVGGFFC